MRALVYLFSMLLVSCNVGNDDIGKSNAVRYVREVIGSMEVKNIEVVETDSLLGDVPMMFAGTALIRTETGYLEDRISADSLRRMIERANRTYQDIGNTWMYGPSDSLRNLYEGCWRVVHTVEVTMPSGKKERTRVLMDGDGITPRCLENEFIESLNKYLPDIDRAKRTLRGW